MQRPRYGVYGDLPGPDPGCPPSWAEEATESHGWRQCCGGTWELLAFLGSLLDPGTSFSALHHPAVSQANPDQGVLQMDLGTDAWGPQLTVRFQPRAGGQDSK